MEVVVDSIQQVLELLLCSLQITRQLESTFLLNREHIYRISMMLIIYFIVTTNPYKDDETKTGTWNFLLGISLSE
jgi:hypothetical protein